MRKKLIIIIVLLIAIVFVAGGIFYLKKQKNASKPSGETLSSQEAGQKALDYINNNLLQSGVTASLKDIAQENGLYKINITVSQDGKTQEGAVYETLDGKFLFIYPPVEIEPKQKQSAKSDKPEVRLFVMAFCPYGNQAEDLMKPVMNLLKDKIDVKLNYIVSKGANEKYASLHGDQELNQDVREICVQKYQKDKFWDFVYKVNEKCTSQNADTCWEQQAKDLGIDTEKIKSCQQTEANALLAEEEKLVNQYGVSGSPTLIINGIEYKGDRTSEGYKTGICSAFNTSPEECQQSLSSDSGTVSGGCGQ